MVLREWYRPLDLLPGSIEIVIDADGILADAVERHHCPVPAKLSVCHPSLSGLVTYS
ncbi:hypothetical protein AB0I10_36680 [Streptomyces sp. NPDC050636]|uniref:hypothetical protein n=1 Tax=Streptomyces sp. NPDC050636 TaxID=3154510 RepID=UPI003423305A